MGIASLIDPTGAKISSSNPLPVTTAIPNGTSSGTTTGAYVVAQTILNVKGAIININNLAVAATMFYKIDGYRSSNAACIAEAITPETGIAAATAVQDVACVSPFARVVVSVKQNSGPGLYQIDYVSW